MGEKVEANELLERKQYGLEWFGYPLGNEIAHIIHAYNMYIYIYHI